MRNPDITERRVEPHLSLGYASRSAPQCQPVSAATSTRRFAHYIVSPIRRIVPLVFALIVLGALYLGWINRDEGHLTAESGAGYWLGIIGGAMMLFMLIYPMRKRVKILRRIGSMPSWFRIHMILGILGPTLVVFHSNFKLGSLNSNVALAAMLTVVASGVVGRYLYTKVHKGLYGRAAEVREILGDAQMLKRALGEELRDTGPLLEELRAFESRALAPRRSFLSSLWSFLILGLRISDSRRRVLHQAEQVIAVEAKRRGWSWRQKRLRMAAFRARLRLYFAAVRKATGFAVFERLLALWHVLHLPLFVLLVVTAIIHVISVHQY